jgi:hypothetical protein
LIHWLPTSKVPAPSGPRAIDDQWSCHRHHPRLRQSPSSIHLPQPNPLVVIPLPRQTSIVQPNPHRTNLPSTARLMAITSRTLTWTWTWSSLETLYSPVRRFQVQMIRQPRNRLSNQSSTPCLRLYNDSIDVYILKNHSLNCFSLVSQAAHYICLFSLSIGSNFPLVNVHFRCQATSFAYKRHRLCAVEIDYEIKLDLGIPFYNIHALPPSFHGLYISSSIFHIFSLTFLIPPSSLPHRLPFSSSSVLLLVHHLNTAYTLIILYWSWPSAIPHTSLPRPYLTVETISLSRCTYPDSITTTTTTIKGLIMQFI